MLRKIFCVDGCIKRFENVKITNAREFSRNETTTHLVSFVTISNTFVCYNCFFTLNIKFFFEYTGLTSFAHHILIYACSSKE